MAWNEGTMSQSAGVLLSVLDTYLVANDYWSVYDASAGTNAKVYRNYDASANVDYYVKVDDNYANYAKIELWEGWDSGSHLGTGNSLTSDLYIIKPNGGYGIAVSDHRFIFVKLTAGQASYVGQLRRFDASKNMPTAIVNNATSTPSNPLGYYNYIGHAKWVCLFDETGSVGREIYPRSGNANRQELVTIASTVILFETLVINNITYRVMGQLEGVCRYYTASGGLTNGQTVSLNGYEWLVVDDGSRGCLIKKA